MIWTARSVDEVQCWYIGGHTVFNPDDVDQPAIDELILNEVDGLSISITSPERMRSVIQKALVPMGLPAVTYDSNGPMSGQASYIGTDNFFFGKQLSKVLKHIQPMRGIFAIIMDSTPNIIARINGVKDALTAESGWCEVSIAPSNMQGNPSLAITLMVRELISTILDLTVIIPVMGAPMFLPEEWTQLIEDYLNTTLLLAMT